MNKKIICFDVDGTFLKYSTWALFWKGVNSTLDAPIENYRNYFFNKINYSTYLETSIFQVNSIAKDKRKKEYISSIFQDLNIKPNRIEVLEYIKSLGYKTYFISGCFPAAAESLVNHLYNRNLIEKDNYFHPKLVFDKKNYLIQIEDLPEDLHTGEDYKVKSIKYIIKKENVKIEDILYIGDVLN